MKIMITGSSGQLGSELARQLLQGGCDLGQLPAIYQGAQVLCPNRSQLDLPDAESIYKAVLDSAPDLVLHCAAKTAVDQCEEEPEATFQINAEGTKFLAQACANHSARLVYISSDYVFSGEGTSPYREDEPCEPRSIYGKSKWMGEVYARQECPQTIILRTAWMYGLKGNNFVNTILRKGKEGKPFRVVDDQWGSPSNAMDVAYHLLWLAAKTDSGIYHCAGAGSCTWFEFAKAILDEARILCQIIPCASGEYPSKVRRPRYSVLDHQKLYQLLNSAPRHWRPALKDYINQLEGLQ